MHRSERNAATNLRDSDLFHRHNEKMDTLLPFRAPPLLPVDFSAIEAAAARIRGHAILTPLLTSPDLDARTGGRVFLKPELLQIGGSFKFRGAYNRLAAMTQEERARGVVAASTGNHAQGIAHAARRLGMKATIVMPDDAPRVKYDNTVALGAEVITFDRMKEDRDTLGRRIAEERGCVFVPPYDDSYVIAGQGTIGLELAAQTPVRLDDVLVCCGGGGLSGGIALALKHCSPHTRVHVVEPVGYDDTVRSLELGERVPMDKNAKSICDAIAVAMPGALTFPILQSCGAGGVVVTDEDVKAAMRYAFSILKLVVEPGGAVALAAVLSGAFPVKGRNVAILLSGGNVDPAFFAKVIAE